MREVPSQGVSKQTLQRLPVYLSYLEGPARSSQVHLGNSNSRSAEHEPCGGEKDLASISSSGRPKVGYVREDLIYELEGFLGYDNTQDAVLEAPASLASAACLRWLCGVWPQHLGWVRYGPVHRQHGGGGKMILPWTAWKTSASG